MKIEIVLDTPRGLAISDVTDIVKVALLSAGCWVRILSADDGSTYTREVNHEVIGKQSVGS